MARVIIAGVIVTYLLAVVQTTLGGRIVLWSVAPDLPFVWTICVGLLEGPESGALVGFGSGMIQGLLGQSHIGVLGISKTLAGFAAGLLSAQFARDAWFTPAISAFLLTLGNDLIFSRDAPHLAHAICVRAGYHAVLAPLFYMLASRGRRALTASPARVG
jgi:rod shape-determining protein MreD